MARVVFVLVSVVMISIITAEIESNFYREEACAKTNGFCLLENECPVSVTKEFKGLCADQKTQGAVCCENFPQEEVNCFQSHNACEDTCPKGLSLGRKGCPNGKTCCVLV